AGRGRMLHQGRRPGGTPSGARVRTRDPGSGTFPGPWQHRLGRAHHAVPPRGSPQQQEEHGSNNMNRSELVAALADRAEVTRTDAGAVLAAVAAVVGDILSKRAEKVTIPGLLTFERPPRAARTPP